jgi:hypothetical protein
MKKLFFTLIAFGFYANAFATIRRVNNKGHRIILGTRQKVSLI